MVKRLFFITILIFLTSNIYGVSRSTVSEPDSVTIYRDGYGYFIEKLDSDELKDSKIELPATLDIKSVRIFYKNRAQTGVEIEARYRIEEKKKILESYILKFTPKKWHNGEYILKYGSTGIIWSPNIDISIIDNKKISLLLTASIDNKAIKLTNCDIKVASGAGNLKSKFYYTQSYNTYYNNARESDILYTVGRHSIKKGSNSIIPIISGDLKYREKYIWYTSTRERVRRVLVTSNSLTIPLPPSDVVIYKNGTPLAKDFIEYTPNGVEFFVKGGKNRLIEVFKDVDTFQTKRKIRKFTHKIEFEIKNRSKKGVELEVLFEKKFSSYYRGNKTLYEYEQKPTKKPGNYLIWVLKLNPKTEKKINFKFFSDQLRYNEYNNYDKAEFSMY